MSTDPEPISTWLQSSVSALTSQCSIVLYCGFFFLQYTPRNLSWTRILAEMTRTNETASRHVVGVFPPWLGRQGGNPSPQVSQTGCRAKAQVQSGLVSRPSRRRLGKQQWARGLAELSDPRPAGRQQDHDVREAANLNLPDRNLPDRSRFSQDSSDSWLAPPCLES